MPPFPRPHLNLRLSHPTVSSLRSSPIIRITPHTAALQSQKAPTFGPQFSSTSTPTPAPKTSSIPTKQPPHVPLHEPLPIKAQPASFPVTSSTIAFSPAIPSSQQPVVQAFLTNFIAKGYADVDVSFGDAETMHVTYGPPLFVRVDPNLEVSGTAEAEEPLVEALEAARSAGVLEEGERWEIESVVGALRHRNEGEERIE